MALLVVALGAVPVVTVADDPADAIAAFVAGYHELGQFNGVVLVAANGQVILAKGYGPANAEWGIPNQPDTKFRLGSITKQFTATLVMQLVEEGKLTLDTPLADALPYYRKDGGGKATIRQLLNHTSGIPSYTSLPGFSGEISRNPYGVEQFVTRYCSGDLEFAPGSQFRYNNSGYFLLGAVIEQVTGKPYEQVLREKILGPLGMRDTGYDHWGDVVARRATGYERSPAGLRTAPYLDMSIPYAAGALYSTARDLYLWDQALYGDALLSAQSREAMFTPGLENYGFGWFIRRLPVGPAKAERTVVGHGGGINGFNTLIRRVTEDRHLVVLLNNTGGTRLEAMSNGVLDVLYGRTPPRPREPLTELLRTTIDEQGIDAAVARYHELKKTEFDSYDFEESQLNELGYQLLAANKVDAAIAIFQLNVEAFPQSFNVYDSLAEGYMTAGKRELAIKNYAKSLELNAGNRNAVEQLVKLMAK
jgi:CubicO group peptidase (beta-lactamase class C family)